MMAQEIKLKPTPTWLCRYCKFVWPRSWGYHCPQCYDLKVGSLESRVLRRNQKKPQRTV